MRFDQWQTKREKAKVTLYDLKVLCEDNKTLLNAQYTKYILTIWKPKATNPYIYYSFKDIQRRADYIKKAIQGQKAHLERVQEYKAQRQITPELSQQLKKGDIFVTSWGYDQTNYDYIAVIEVSSSGKTAKCMRTSSLHMGESCQSNVQEPIFCPFGDTFTMKITKGYDGRVSLRGSYPFLHNGIINDSFGGKNLRLDTFDKHTIGSQYHETMSQFGH